MDITEITKEALLAGWQIWSCSCVCGGNYTWMKPRPSGAFETYGCICHNTPTEEEIIETIRQRKR